MDIRLKMFKCKPYSDSLIGPWRILSDKIFFGNPLPPERAPAVGHDLVQTLTAGLQHFVLKATMKHGCILVRAQRQLKRATYIFTRGPV